jgi:hypothetical protein
MTEKDITAFVQDLTALLNVHSMENGSHTPDFMLAEYLLKCLQTWNVMVMNREAWYGRVPQPVPASVPPHTKQILSYDEQHLEQAQQVQPAYWAQLKRHER